MSRTVRDLVDALRPDHDADVEPIRFLLETARRRRLRRARRRLLAAGLSALVAVLVLIGLPVAFSARSHRGESPAQPTTPSVTTPAPTPSLQRKPTLTTRLRADTVDGWAITPSVLADWGQEATASVSTTAGITAALITVYEPGEFDPTQVRLGRPATARGQSAWYRVMVDPETSGAGTALKPAQSVLAWPYGPDAWVAISGSFDRNSDAVPVLLQELADGLVIRDPAPVPVPFTLSYLPAGIHPATVYLSAYRQIGLTFDSDVKPGDRHDPNRYQRVPLTVEMLDARPWQFTANTTLGGLPAMRENHRITLQRDGYWLMFESGPLAAALSQAEYERIFAAMSFDDWQDSSSWTPSTLSVPTRGS